MKKEQKKQLLALMLYLLNCLYIVKNQAREKDYNKPSAFTEALAFWP